MTNADEFVSFASFDDWQAEWQRAGSHKVKNSDTALTLLARHVEVNFRPDGFRMFQNGCQPLLERREGDLREEIVFVPAPHMHSCTHLPFSVQIYISSKSIAAVRSRYWRPAIRAPEVIAGGNVGLFSIPPGYHIYSASQTMRCSNRISAMLRHKVLGWFDVFRSPMLLRNHIYRGDLELVSESTSIELLLSEFDPFEARNYVRRHLRRPRINRGPIHEIEGYDLASNRVEPLTAYYKL